MEELVELRRILQNPIAKCHFQASEESLNTKLDAIALIMLDLHAESC